MHKLALLRGEGHHQDNQLLETDMMRFLAIIGIVFWIIFALIKSIPFQTAEEGSQLNPSVPEKITVPKIPQLAAPMEAEVDEHSVSKKQSPQRDLSQPERSRREATSQATDKTESRKPAPKKWAGLRMEFHSLDDLLVLMHTQKVRVFGRAKAIGFDLFFAGHPEGDTVNFKGITSLPAKLWEIKSGKDHAYFLALMVKTYPAISSFPTRQVLVSFTDAELEKRVEDTLMRLEQEGQNGTLSITRTGEVVFEGSSSS